MEFYDLIKIYKSEWEEVSSRKFTEAEVNAVQEATVVASKYGKSVCFFIPSKGKGFVPLEPIAKVNLGDKLNMSEIELVNLKYIGNDINQAKDHIMRIRVPEKNDQLEVVSFDNPFGV